MNEAGGALHDGAEAAIPARSLDGNKHSHAIVGLPVTVDEVRVAFLRFEEVAAAILSDADFQEVTSGSGVARKIKAKSAWYKLAIAYDLTEVAELGRLEISRDANSRPINASARVVMQAPNGRRATGHHECNVLEKCCAAAVGEACFFTRFEDHRCCPNGCDGRAHWNLPGDIVATAHTRAKARAIADLIGAGAPNAEDAPGSEQPPVQSDAAPPKSGALYENGKAMTPAQAKRLASLAKELGFSCEYNGPAVALVKTRGLRIPAGEPAIELARLTRRMASILISHYGQLAKEASGKAGRA